MTSYSPRRSRLVPAPAAPRSVREAAIGPGPAPPIGLDRAGLPGVKSGAPIPSGRRLAAEAMPISTYRLPVRRPNVLSEIRDVAAAPVPEKRHLVRIASVPE